MTTKKHEGGRTPLEPGKKAKVLGFSIGESEYEEFMRDVARFEGSDRGANSRMFRRIYRAWKHSLNQVLGEPEDNRRAI